MKISLMWSLNEDFSRIFIPPIAESRGETILQLNVNSTGFLDCSFLGAVHLV